MKELKQLKNKLKQDNLWSIYKKKFNDKSMRLILSYIILIYKPSTSIDEMIEIEKELITKKNDESMFNSVFIKVKEITNKNFDWESFGKFMWYVYQTSTYYKDIKKNVENIYTTENFIQINKIKTNLFFKWLQSIPVNEEKYNFNIRLIMSRVF